MDDDYLSLQLLDSSGKPPTPLHNALYAEQGFEPPASSIVDELTGSRRRASIGAALFQHPENVHGEVTAPLVSDGCWENIRCTQSALPCALGLGSDDCYTIPTKPILERFMEHYFLCVHPMLPVLNEGDFWDTFTTTDETKSPDILLLQAMLFAACPVSPLTCPFNN